MKVGAIHTNRAIAPSRGVLHVFNLIETRGLLTRLSQRLLGPVEAKLRLSLEVKFPPD